MPSRRNSTSPSESSLSTARRSQKASRLKTTREQFSACGACRMRRVRCDLKDLPVSRAGRHSSCSNCKERGFKCVDEFSQIKSVKLLRRGRRLQQAEAIYGKAKAGEEDDPLIIGPSPPPNVTPMPTSAFFDSQFWRRFQLQCPIIEPHEFVPRFITPRKGMPDPLGTAGRLLAMALVAWASSFGIDENGRPMDPSEDHISQHQEVDVHDQFNADASAKLRTERRTRTNEMVKEMLYLIDIHGILRKPSWDGVRILLMILPLTQDVQSNLERLTMYESTISLIYALTSTAAVSSVNSGKGEYVDALVRARIFWSGILHDWMVNGLRGGRMYLNGFDLGLFEETLPPLDPPNSGADISHLKAYSIVYRYFTPLLQLAIACRLVHTAVTGPEARSKNIIDEEMLQRAWGIFDKAWFEIDQIRLSDLSGTAFTPQEIEAYIASWKIFTFECNNIIREALKRRLDEFGLVTQDHSLETSSHGCREMVQRLYSIAQFKCHYLVRTVCSLIRHHLGTSFFQYDASQVRDGVLFAGLLLANDGIGSAEDINLCVSALREMRWAYSKSEEREQSIRMAWQVKSSGSQYKSTPYIPSSFSPSYPAPSVGHFRAAVHPDIEIPAFISVSSSSSSDEPHWPGPATSKLDASSPSSFHHGLPSPTTESTRRLCISVTPTLPATSEGHPTPAYHYAPDPEALHYSDRFTYPYPTCKGSPFVSDTSPTMYHSQGLNNPTVTGFFPDSSSPPIPGASANYPTTQFHYIGN